MDSSHETVQHLPSGLLTPRQHQPNSLHAFTLLFIPYMDTCEKLKNKNNSNLMLKDILL